LIEKINEKREQRGKKQSDGERPFQVSQIALFAAVPRNWKKVVQVFPGFFPESHAG
jgi:hypothetical protein